MAECIVEEITAAQKASYDAQDLKAQQHMALWALLMVLVSAATVGVTVWALTYIKQTLDETRKMARDTSRMAKEAKRATKAAVAATEITHEANRIARDMGQAQVRAYLSVVDCTAQYKGDRWVVGCNVKNTGQSPAEKVLWEPTLALFAKSCDSFRILTPEPLGKKLLIDVPSQEPGALPVRTFMSGLTQGEIGALRTGNELTIRLSVNVRGRDVFDEPLRLDADLMYIFQRNLMLNEGVNLTKVASAEDDD